jgi:hypothetical protein
MILSDKNLFVHTSVSANLYEAITEYLSSNPSSTIYHHPLWLQILAEETNQQQYYIIYRNSKNKIEGLIPLLFTRGVPFMNSPLSCKRISSLPRTPFAGIVADNPAVCSALLKGLREFSSDFPEYLVQLKSNQNYNLIDSSFKTSEWRSNYIKIIPAKNDKLTFGSVKDEKDIYRALKRANDNKVYLKKGETLNELKVWYKMYLNIMRLNRIPSRSFTFFEKLWNKLRPAGLLDINYAMIRRNGKEQIINGTINYMFNRKYFGGFKAGDYDYSRYMGGDLIIYNELLELHEKEFISYDLGEVSSANTTLDKYKTKWGVEKEKIYHNYFGKFEAEKLELLDSAPSNGVLTQLWKKLPLNVTAKLGGAVNRFL